MVTLGEVKRSRVKRVAGVCPSSPEFTDLVNEGTSMLLNRGSWWGTIKRMSFCTYNSCLVFPRQVGTLLALSTCGGSIPPKNQWFSFNAVLPDDVNWYIRNGNWGAYNFGLGNQCAFVGMDGGTSPVFNQIPCPQARYLRFYITRRSDIGKTITVFGQDGNGLVIRSSRSDGTFQDGVLLTLDAPYVETPILIRRVDRIYKDLTDGPIYGYQWDGANNYNLAWYEPSETSPDYRTTKVLGGCQCAQRNIPCNCAPIQMQALVKIQFVPALYDDDLVQIDNLDALASMVKAIKLGDSYNAVEREAAIAQAVKEMNLELRNRLPIDQTVARVHYQGTSQLWKQMIGLQT